MADGLVALQAQLTEAAERALEWTAYEDAVALSFIAATWPLVESALAAERQAGRQEGREEAAEAIKDDNVYPDDGPAYRAGLRFAAMLARGTVSPSPEPEQQACGSHRGPQGPNEDVAQCQRCWSVSYELRPEGETYGEHLPDCSLPRRHESYCKPGGQGHPPAAHIRGFWPSPVPTEEQQ